MKYLIGLMLAGSVLIFAPASFADPKCKPGGNPKWCSEPIQDKNENGKTICCYMMECSK